jgi:hypothetical protein
MFAFGTRKVEHSSFIDTLGIVLEGVLGNSENRRGLLRIINEDNSLPAGIVIVLGRLWAFAVAVPKLLIWSMYVGILTCAYWDVDFQRKCEEPLKEHFRVPPWSVYFFSKFYEYKVLRPFFQDPDFCEAIEQMERDSAAWREALDAVDSDQLIRSVRKDVAGGDKELELRDAMELFTGTDSQAEKYAKASKWMMDVCKKTGLKMKRMQVKSSTKLELRVLTDKLNKLEEEACGLAMQLNGQVKEVNCLLKPI